MQTTQRVEVKQIVEMDRITMLEKLDTAQKAIASVSWAFPSDDTRCMALVTIEQLIFNLQDEIDEA